MTPSPSEPRADRRVMGLGLFLGLLATGWSVAGCTIPRWPVAGDFTSPYGLRWNGGPDIHRGVDVSVPSGTPVYAMSDGRVRFAGVMSGFGNVIWVDHGGDVLTVYAHLSQVDVSEGQSVSRDRPIGLSGQSGNASGPHLHFEVWRRGSRDRSSPRARRIPKARR